MSKRVLLLALLSLSLALASCKHKGVPAPETLTALTEPEATAFAETLSQALSQCDAPTLHALFDLNSMMRRALRASKAPGKAQKSILKGLEASISEIPTQFCSNSETPTKLEFLRIHSRAGARPLLYRQLAEDSLNYIEFYAGKSKNGHIRIDNIFIYVNGQTIVETVEQMINVLLGDNAMTTKFGTLDELIDEDPSAALEEIMSFPKDIRNAKPIQLLALRAAAEVSDAKYADAVAEFQTIYPGDPALNLIAMNGYVVRQDYASALARLDLLDASVDGDPHLDTLRVGLLMDEGKDMPRATQLAETYLEAHPESEDAHYLLLTVHVKARNYAGAVAMFQLLGERFDLVFENEGLDPGDADYAALKESLEWQAYISKTTL